METLDYFTRLQAIAGLKMLLPPSDDHDPNNVRLNIRFPPHQHGLPAILVGSTNPAATHPTTQLKTNNALLFVFQTV